MLSGKPWTKCNSSYVGMNVCTCAIIHSDLAHALGRTISPKGGTAICLNMLRVQLFITGKNENNPRIKKKAK